CNTVSPTIPTRRSSELHGPFETPKAPPRRGLRAVRGEGLEPPCPRTHGPEPCASTSFAILAGRRPGDFREREGRPKAPGRQARSHGPSSLDGRPSAWRVPGVRLPLDG